MIAKDIDDQACPGGRAEDGEPTIERRPAAFGPPSRPRADSSPFC